MAPRERGRFAGYFATVFALASTSGPVLGAFLTEHLSWRAVFAINLPLGLLAALLALRVPDHRPAEREPLPARHRRRTAVLPRRPLALLFALSSAGHRFAWLSWPMAALFGGALVAVRRAGWWERRAHDPVIPLRFIGVPAIARVERRGAVLRRRAVLHHSLPAALSAARPRARHRPVGPAAAADHACAW